MKNNRANSFKTLTKISFNTAISIYLTRIDFVYNRYYICIV